MIESSELGEIWVVVNVNGHRIIEDYYISSYGRLCSMKYGKQKIVNGSLNRKGYVMDKYFTRDENGNVEKISAQRHRVMMFSFGIIQPEGCDQVDHINGIKSDNSLINLEWVDCKTNIQRSWKNGLHSNDIRYGENSPNSKWKTEDVEKAFELKIEGKKNPEISKITGISLDSLQKMFHGLSWRRIYDKYKDKLNK